MKKHQVIPTMLLAGLAVAGCQRQDNEVKEQLHDLKQAEQNSPNVAKSLEQQLANAKAEVVRLEEKLALAKQGVTGDVLKERQELDQALRDQEKKVDTKVQEAESAARAHNQDAVKAREELEHTQPAHRVEARVKTETELVPNQAPRVETKTQQATIPVQSTHMVENEQVQQPGTAEQRARETPMPNGSPNDAARRARSAAVQPAAPSSQPVAPSLPAATP